ncbi:MAG: hypothetical protein ABSA72_06285, partial [Nitrososphaerales archaeon]
AVRREVVTGVREEMGRPVATGLVLRPLHRRGMPAGVHAHPWQSGPACHTGNETCFFRKL